MTHPPFPAQPVPSWYLHADWSSAGGKRNGVFYVGDEIELKFDEFSTDPPPLATTFESGMAGNPVSFTDWGSPNAISGQGSPVPLYDDAHFHSGSQSCKIRGDSLQWVGWGGAPPDPEFFRIYLYATAFPSGTSTLMTSNNNLNLHVNSSGKLIARDQGFSHVYTFTAPIALDQWVRIEGTFSCAAKTVEVRLFNSPESGTPDESFSDTAWAFNGTNNSFTCGVQNLNWGSDIWIDDLAAFFDDWPGPIDLGNLPVSTRDYEIRDFFGKIVSSGTALRSPFTPATPQGGWKPGWYRVYMTGPNTDSLFADSYGATNFCVVRNDAHFVAMPDPTLPSGYNDEGPDYPMKGIMGLGTSRLLIQHANDLNAGTNNITNAQLDAALTADYWSNNGIPDAERPPREPWCLFPNDGMDKIIIHMPGGASWENAGHVYVKDTSIDGAQVFITVAAGTNANTDKILVHYPDAGTLVETWDNLVDSNDAATRINGGSNYIRYYWDSQHRRNEARAQSAIGTDFYDGIVSAVGTLYPLGVTRFEGPSNEPPLNARTAHEMMLFQAAVHEGNAAAKAIGPCPVDIGDLTDPGNPGAWTWQIFFDAGGGNYCDEFSFHAYNAVTNGDLNLGRYTIQSFLDLLDSYGYGAKPLWQTESVGAMNFDYGVYHPRRARKALIETLLFEQMGLPRERNNWWYDVAHGFASVPAWQENGDRSLEPQVVLGRVLAEETWGKPFISALDFGTYGNAMYLGNVYTNAAGESTIALMATCYMTGASIVLEIVGTSSPLTVVDGFGNEKTMPQSKGRITVPMTDIPAYVRLPSGAAASVYRINGHSPLGIGTSVSPSSTTKQIDGVTYSELADDLWMEHYYPTIGMVPATWAEPPSDMTLIWTGSKTIERVMVWCGPAWQVAGTLIDFDVQTYDGAVWTTQRTITKDSPPYFLFTSDSYSAACWVETFWDEQWVFDVELPQPVDCQGVRVHVREASYGGEPLPTTDFGQGNDRQGYRIQEISVTDANRYAGVG